jgi:predicted kinase
MGRPGWILDGLNGTARWGSDAAEVLAPEFTALVPPDVFTGLVRQQAVTFAPGTVPGLDASDHAALARVRVRDGSLQEVACTAEPAAPHRITATRTMALIPSSLTPRPPADFTRYPQLAGRGAGARAIVFSGLPGTGKSTLAEAAGRHLRAPVIAVDWLLGSLTPFGGYHLNELPGIGTELLTTLAFRQLEIGQPAILDSPAEDLATTTRWLTLARAAGARFQVIVCTCSDQELHRARLERRERGIPGWHEGGNLGQRPAAAGGVPAADRRGADHRRRPAAGTEPGQRARLRDGLIQPRGLSGQHAPSCAGGWRLDRLAVRSE